MLDPEQWADGIEKRRKEAAEANKVEQEAFVARRELFKEEAPALWPKVVEAFQSFCDSYNKRRDILYRADIGPQAFVVRRKDVAGLAITVQSAQGFRLLVTSDVERYRVLYEVSVFANGHGTVSYVSDGTPITPEEIAAAALEQFLQV